MRKNLNKAIQAFLEAEIERIYRRDRIGDAISQFNEGAITLVELRNYLNMEVNLLELDARNNLIAKLGFDPNQFNDIVTEPQR